VVHFIKSQYFSVFCLIVGSYLLASSSWDIYAILTRAKTTAIKTAKTVKKQHVRLVAMMKAWEWRWDWWRMATMRPPVLCVCGLRVNPRNQRFCVRCGKEVRR